MLLFSKDNDKLLNLNSETALNIAKEFKNRISNSQAWDGMIFIDSDELKGGVFRFEKMLGV